MKKRLLSLVLMVALAVTAVPAETFAYGKEMAVAAGWTKLSAYEASGTGALHRTASIKSTGTASDVPGDDEIAKAPLFTTTTEAGSYLRGQMKQRVTDVLLRVSGQYDDETISVLNEAIRHTGVSDEGDALNGQRDTTKTDAWQNTQTNECIYRYQFTYRTTSAEEQELKTALARIEADIPWGATDDEEMHAVRGAYRYLIENYSYDSASYEKHQAGVQTIAQDKTVAQSYTAYGAYKQKSAVCLGLAEMLYRILLDRGIDTRILVSKTHAWNAVRVEGEWYMCDATGDVQKGFKDVPEHYLISRSELAELGSSYDWNADTMWDYNVVDAYDWASRAWNDLTASIIRDFKRVVKLVKGNTDGKQKAVLTDADGTKLKEGKDYTVAYEYGSFENGKYNSKAVYTGTGSYSGTVEKYFNRTMEAPQIVKVEQKVLDTGSWNMGVQYCLQTTAYIKPPQFPADTYCDSDAIVLAIKGGSNAGTTVQAPYNHKKDKKFPEVKVKQMKDGTVRITFYTNLITNKGSKTMKNPLTPTIFAYATCAVSGGYKGIDIIRVESMSRTYQFPTIKKINPKFKKTYNAAQLKKLKDTKERFDKNDNIAYEASRQSYQKSLNYYLKTGRYC